MGGSHLVEALTQQMIEEAQKYIDEVEQEGENDESDRSGNSEDENRRSGS